MKLTMYFILPFVVAVLNNEIVAGLQEDKRVDKMGKRNSLTMSLLTGKENFKNIDGSERDMSDYPTVRQKRSDIGKDFSMYINVYESQVRNPIMALSKEVQVRDNLIALSESLGSIVQNMEALSEDIELSTDQDEVAYNQVFYAREERELLLRFAIYNDLLEDMKNGPEGDKLESIKPIAIPGGFPEIKLSDSDKAFLNELKKRIFRYEVVTPNSTE